MKKGLPVVLLLALATGTGYYYFSGHQSETYDLLKTDMAREEENEKGNKEQRAFFVRERVRHEIRMLQDPATGKIPSTVRLEELKLARTLPEREREGPLGPTNLNTYQEAGPNNIGGRTRAVAFDKRYNGGSNRVILAGCVSGGILRSTDGGATWTRVSPDNDIHNLTSLVQDPRPGQENTWYAGGGENLGNSAEGTGSLFLGFGVWKSVNNGVSWTKLPRTIVDLGGNVLGEGSLEGFDNAFDIVHKIVVNPVNGDVYVAGHRRLVRSTNGGNNWNEVFAGATATTMDLGQMDIVCTNTGRFFLGVNGGLPDQNRRGVWTSTNGTTWTRLAGGSVLGTDSVAGWRGNSYTGDAKRIVLGLAPSNQNIVYITYENGDSQASPELKNEADLFKLDISSGNNWTNLSANVPNFPGNLDGVDPFPVQGGYNLMITVKPDDPNTVFLGGVNLFRSTSGFSNTTATAWIGGYGSNFAAGLNVYGSQNNPGDITKWSHPDMHALVFDPSNPNRAISANDGGIQVTDNIMTNIAGVEPVLWNVLTNYQTLQYYHVAMDPGSARNNFIGGAQDNGTRFRDASGILGTPTNNNQFRLISGDGGAAAIAKAGTNSQLVYGSTQFGNIIRATLSTGSATGGSIRPTGLTAFPGLDNAFGDFVTYFKIDFDNTDDLYYVNFNRLFRTTSAPTVTSSTWTELTGVRAAVNPASPANGTNISISALELTRGTYGSNHALYIGTSNGKIFRLDNPRGAAAGATPANITPTLMTAGSYISDIAVNPNNDEEIMVVASNYNVVSIWWTKNAKAAVPVWFNIEGNLTLPSIRSCMIVVNKDGSNNPATEYYVGTSIGLYSAVNISNLTPTGSVVNVAWAREGGSTLNFAVIPSLDYRPQDNVLLVGTHGNGMYFGSTGTPDFRPVAPTGLPDPIRNDKRFVQKAYPTIATDKLYYQTGDMFTVKKIIVRVHSVSGQELLRKETSFSSGEVDTRKLAKGNYVLTITSDDYKQQFVQQFTKN
jgi:hypothetical protein